MQLNRITPSIHTLSIPIYYDIHSIIIYKRNGKASQRVPGIIQHYGQFSILSHSFHWLHSESRAYKRMRKSIAQRSEKNRAYKYVISQHSCTFLYIRGKKNKKKFSTHFAALVILMIANLHDRTVLRAYFIYRMKYYVSLLSRYAITTNHAGSRIFHAGLFARSIALRTNANFSLFAQLISQL